MAEITSKIGRRKTAVARISMTPGKGQIKINGRMLTDYFPSEILQIVVNQPFALTNTVGSFDVTANVDGGGIKGQAEALRLGISRALVEIDPECKSKLRAEGFITRDPRAVERKKPGQPKARKRFQFSKR